MARSYADANFVSNFSNS